MTPLNSIEIKLCQKQAKIFERSVAKTNCSSLVFIRRYMYSSIAKMMDNKSYLFISETDDDSFETIEKEFGPTGYRKKHTLDQMFWIGYIYRCLSIKYDLPSKTVYKLFNGRKIFKYYNICHTFDIVDAAERMMESISIKNLSIEQKAYEVMKELLLEQKEKELSSKCRLIDCY